MATVEVGRRAKLQEITDSPKARKPATARLAEFLSLAERTGKLSIKERLRIVEQALLLLEMNYVHLPLKRAMHAIDPIQQLKLLRFRLSEMKERDLPSAMHFHQRMLSIFGSARDLHTMYLLPEPYKDRAAYLPFLVEQYFDHRGGRRVEKFMISRMVPSDETTGQQSSGTAKFEPGVEVLYWNGVPIRRAIEINGETQAGSNAEAQFARGLDNLTIRPLDSSLPPDELWVDVTYRTEAGVIATHRQDWLVYKTDDVDSTSVYSRNSKKKRAAIDIKKKRINDVKRNLYAPTAIRKLGSIKDVAYAESRTVDGRDFGYVRLFSFDVSDPDGFINRFSRLITASGFPKDGLILDVRGNGGGKIRAGERLLQLFTPNRIKPELFEFINTPLNLELCRLAPKNWNLRRWADSIAEAVGTGATYSMGFPLSSEESCNSIGQVYYGPVVLITDALSYSTTDIFAAGFQDNEIGVVLGTSGNTGAGGANVWWYDDFSEALGSHSQSPFKPLPKGANMMVAARRSIRVGRRAGGPLEELGVTPDARHFMTRRDIIQNNDDLIARAAEIIKDKPVLMLSVKPIPGKDVPGVILTASSRVRSSGQGEEISRLDIYVGDRPWKSLNVEVGSVRSKRVAIPKAGKGPTKVVVEARDGANRLVAVRRLVV